MAKLSTDELLEAFKEMTLIELSEFVKQFEETFNVTAAAPVAVAGSEVDAAVGADLHGPDASVPSLEEFLLLDHPHPRRIEADAPQVPPRAVGRESQGSEEEAAVPRVDGPAVEGCPRRGDDRVVASQGRGEAAPVARGGHGIGPAVVGARFDAVDLVPRVGAVFDRE